MNILVVIPARYQSTRFPGKPLAKIKGKPMIQCTYEQAIQTGFPVVVATDDERIQKVVSDFGGQVVMTDVSHTNGTSRCFEAVNVWETMSNKEVDVVINVQGDEPFVQPEQIQNLSKAFTDTTVDIATLAQKIVKEEELFNPNVVKLVRDTRGYALYFSRAVIPFLRDFLPEEWLEKHSFFKHIGMYAYTKKALNSIVTLPQGTLELGENLEQLRWLENGYTIAVLETMHQSIGIDTPEDLEQIK